MVHMSSGYAALAAAIYFGKGLKPPPGFEHTLEPANVPYVMLGTALLWFGWFGVRSARAHKRAHTHAPRREGGRAAAAAGRGFSVRVSASRVLPPTHKPRPRP